MRIERVVWWTVGFACAWMGGAEADDVVDICLTSYISGVDQVGLDSSSAQLSKLLSESQKAACEVVAGRVNPEREDPKDWAYLSENNCPFFVSSCQQDVEEYRKLRMKNAYEAAARRGDHLLGHGCRMSLGTWFDLAENAKAAGDGKRHLAIIGGATKMASDLYSQCVQLRGASDPGCVVLLGQIERFKKAREDFLKTYGTAQVSFTTAQLKAACKAAEGSDGGGLSIVPKAMPFDPTASALIRAAGKRLCSSDQSLSGSFLPPGEYTLVGSSTAFTVAPAR